MTRTKPTKGPWYFTYGSIYTTPDGPEDGGYRVLLADRNCDHTTPTERDSNCRLAAAAPDLLEALKNILEIAGPGRRHHKMIQQAQAAIAKAEGGL